ncbi:MAG: MarR family winged helix-turn-helix transcriptional regulator, partial [Pseudomonadales bacterium]|nr:MarR family winged helix-turn-helix transcriptional regulator [Pseudomonadales bacterium]
MTLLARHKNLTRHEICVQTGLTGAGLSRNIKVLVEADLVTDFPEVSEQNQKGRRRSVLSLNAGGAFVIGITLSANRKQICIMNCARDIISQRDFDDLDVSDPARVLDHLINEAKAIIVEAGIDHGRVLGAGVVLGTSSADPIDDFVSMPVLGWQDIPILSKLREGLAMPVGLMSRSEALLRVEEVRAMDDG